MLISTSISFPKRFGLCLTDNDCECGELLILITMIFKHCSCSTRLSIKMNLLINVKMSTIVGILTFISMINTTSESLKKARKVNFQHKFFFEQLKFHAQLS